MGIILIPLVGYIWLVTTLGLISYRLAKGIKIKVLTIAQLLLAVGGGLILGLGDSFGTSNLAISILMSIGAVSFLAMLLAVPLYIITSLQKMFVTESRPSDKQS